jgi:hypothetical protein
MLGKSLSEDSDWSALEFSSFSEKDSSLTSLTKSSLFLECLLLPLLLLLSLLSKKILIISRGTI